MIDHAIRYAQAGWKIFPLRGKKPRTAHGKDDATSDVEKVRKWWTMWPDADIGFVPEDHVVVDIDPRHNGHFTLADLEMEHGVLATPLEVRTGRGDGGRHLYFAQPDAVVLKKGAIFKDAGIDLICSSSAYCILPPSKHEDTGMPYEWAIEGEFDDIPVLPDWFVQICTQKTDAPTAAPALVSDPGAYAKGALRRSVVAVESCDEGERNNTLYKKTFCLGKFIEDGTLSLKRVKEEMQAAGEACELPAGEVRKTIEEALKDVRPMNGEAQEPEDLTKWLLPSTDPVDIADHFMKHHPPMKRWRGEWWVYLQGVYIRKSDEFIENLIWQHLYRLWKPTKEGPKRLGTSVSRVSSTEKALRSRPYTFVDGEIRAPVWIDGSLTKQADPANILVTESGLANLKDKSLRSFTSDLFAVNKLTLKWDKDAGCPAWIGFLESLWGEDSEEAQALQEWMGYLLTPDISQQKFMIIHGPSRAGKGTIANVIHHLLGRRNSHSGKLLALRDRFGLWGLEEALSLIMPEVRVNLSNKEFTPILETLLSITTGEPVRVDRKNLSAVSVRIPARITMFANEIPSFTDDSGALGNRAIIMKLQHTFVGREDFKLEDKLRAEAAGILQWSVEGRDRYLDRGRLFIPASSAHAVEELKRDASPLSVFAEQHLEIGGGQWVSSKLVYKRMQQWAEDNGYTQMQHMTPANLSRRLRGIIPTMETKQRRIEGKSERTYENVNLKGALQHD